ncbi:MAG: HlyD family efflux transporter periplasmic adaptor subunit [Saprospiraceae bacterium]|nr:HlyD family efflux transporter periplasmic adaptor subunit [Saprospiraceae bacterium]
MRQVITIVIGIVVLGAGFFIARGLASTEKPARPVKEAVAQTVFTETVKNVDIPVTVVESGSLMAKNRIDLYAEVQGVMQTSGKDFKPGSVYSQGELMVSIRDNDFYAQLQAQKSTLQNLIASALPDLRLDFPEAYEKWDNYIRDFDINEPVAPIPESESDKEKFFITGKNIYTTYYTTKNLEIILSKYRLRAPYNGILIDAIVTPGSLVRPGQKLGEFIDPSVYELEVSVSKSQMDYLAVGKRVVVRDQDTAGKKWNGKITRINGKVDPGTQTVKVFIEVRGKDLYEGLFLEALINGRYEKNAYEINRSLLVDESKVFVVEDNALRLVTVDPVVFNEKTVIVKGLENGREIISKPISGAYTGMVVSVLED